jgi:NDP-sugar pyrophosphorylase family protein
VPEATRIDMPDLLNLGRSAGLKIGLFPVHEYWIDVGRPDDLAAADRHHRDQG